MADCGLIFGMTSNPSLEFTDFVYVIPNIRPQATCKSWRLYKNYMAASSIISQTFGSCLPQTG